MHRIAAKFVPSVLTQDQKDSRVAICQELKASFMLTTHRQNRNLRKGRVLGLQDPKRYVCKKSN